MPFQFHIRPLGDLEQGFELSCEGIFPTRVHHDRLIEAVIHAVQVGHALPAGEIQVHDCDGDLVETLPLRWSPAPLVEMERRAA
jgi:hypothetical protein